MDEHKSPDMNATELDDVTATFSDLDIDGIHLIQRRPTVREAFGDFCHLKPQSRDSQIEAILKTIEDTDIESILNKRGSRFFHASPGVGKTFLLSQLYSLENTRIHFFVADFNRNCCKDAASHNKEFLKDHELFVLFRLYYVECVDQSRLTWIGFMNKSLENLNTSDKKESFKENIRKRLRSRVEQSGCTISVILVDEIQKTQAMCRGLDGIEFSNNCRSYLCQMADTNKDICNLVIFSSLDVAFMKEEVTASGRPMRSVCTLPLLSFDQTLNILNAEVKCLFVNEEDILVNHDVCLRQLADVCGGHARSIEYIVSACNNMRQGNRKELSAIIATASGDLVAAHHQVKDLEILLKAIVLGKEVCTVHVVGDETYESLVNRGVLLNSLDGEGLSEFVPMCPELFLHAWSQSVHVSLDMRRLLRQILDLRGKFTRKRFENLHCSWEQLIRLARPADRYRRIPLRDVYCVKQTDYNDEKRASENAVSCPVDASTKLSLIPYEKDANVKVELNSILSPTDDYNVGWDRLIFYEAFPGKAIRKKFILPVFIQNKFSAAGASTRLTLATVNDSVDSCKKFLATKCSFEKCTLIPEKTKWFSLGSTSYQFVLVFIVKQEAHENTKSKAPSNVIFCFEEDLKILYGKSLSGFVKYLVPDLTVYATPPEANEQPTSTQT